MNERPGAKGPFEIRPARLGDAVFLAETHVASWRENYRGIVSDHALAQMSVPARIRRWREILCIPRPVGAVLLAQDAGGEVVGFGSAGPQREDECPWDGEFYSLYILKAAQRKGLGRRLLTRMAGELIEGGCRSADVWALHENTAAGAFYKAMGGEEDATRAFRMDGEALTETAFAWRDLNVLSCD